MNTSTINVRLMQEEDFEAVVAIDERVLGKARPDYFKVKFELMFDSSDVLPTSLVAEGQDGAVIGFVMGTLYMGEFGIFQEQATLDTIGVRPDHQKRGVGALLLSEFTAHLKSLGVKKISTLVDSNDVRLNRFFNANRFGASRTIHLERSL